MALILSVNAGSSSLKISLYHRVSSSSNPAQLVVTCSVTNISAPPAIFSFNGTTEHVPSDAITDHASAFAHFLSRLTDSGSIRYICHRVVHGGDFTARAVIDDAAYHRIEALSDLAPLHNGAALSVIKACIEKLPGAKSVAYFDSAFHRTIPPHISTYAIDQKVAVQRGLKKYGFHGLSYSFILHAVSQFLSKPPNKLNLIVLHLGSGASVCAIQGGRSLDTSMGLTPVSGLPGATRSGTVDPSLIFHYTNKAGKMTHDPGMAVDLHVTQAEDILNHKAGWSALTGTTDFQVIAKHAKIWEVLSPSPPTDPYTLAFALFIDRIINYVGAYHLKLKGIVDALVFSGGIGEHSKALREIVGQKVACLGYTLPDPDKNIDLEKTEGTVVDFGRKTLGPATRMLVCRTDEQVEMAKGCALDEEFWS